MPGALLGEVSAALLYFLSTWRQNPHEPAAQAGAFLAADGVASRSSRISLRLGSHDPGPVLVFLEDTSLLAANACSSRSSRRWAA